MTEKQLENKIDMLMAMFLTYVGRTTYPNETEKVKWYEYWKKRTGIRPLDYDIDDVELKR